jgi:hypothetical protein
MRKWIDWLTTPDRHGDTPLSMTAFFAVFLWMMAVLMRMPCY